MSRVATDFLRQIISACSRKRSNHSKCQTGSRMRTRPFIPDTRHRPSAARVSPSALHRISVSVLFRFYISYFRFGFGFIISARQRTLTNADERTIHIRQFPTPIIKYQSTLPRVGSPLPTPSLLMTLPVAYGQRPTLGKQLGNPLAYPKQSLSMRETTAPKTAFKYHQHPRHPHKPQCFRGLKFYSIKRPRQNCRGLLIQMVELRSAYPLIS